jgi:hypothetical protein
MKMQAVNVMQAVLWQQQGQQQWCKCYQSWLVAAADDDADDCSGHAIWHVWMPDTVMVQALPHLSSA